MSSADSQPHDFTVIARRVVEETIGHQLVAGDRRGEGGKASSVEPMLAVIGSIVRRNSIRSTVRVTGIPQNRVKAMIVELGHACAQHRQTWIRGLICGKLCCKAMLVLQEKNRGPMSDKTRILHAGSAWTWTCIDLETAFVPLWLVGPDNPETAKVLAEQVGVLRSAISRSTGNQTSEKQPSEIVRIAHPWLATISDGFSRKVRRHAAALELLFAVHNFATANAAGASPAMAAGITDHVWTIAELINLAALE